MKLAPSPPSSNSPKRHQAGMSVVRRVTRSATAGAVALVLAAGAVGVTPLVATAKSSDTTPTETTARTAYLTAADKICATSNDHLLAAAKKYETHLVIIRRGARTQGGRS